MRGLSKVLPEKDTGVGGGVNHCAFLNPSQRYSRQKPKDADEPLNHCEKLLISMPGATSRSLS